jgi:hypothetical protein
MRAGLRDGVRANSAGFRGGFQIAVTATLIPKCVALELEIGISSTSSRQRSSSRKSDSLSKSQGSGSFSGGRVRDVFMDRFLSVRARNGVAGDPAAFPGLVTCDSRCGAFQVANLSDSDVGCQEGNKNNIKTVNGVRSGL